MSLPEWPGADKAYTRAQEYMAKYGADHALIDALNKGDEERIKGILLDYNFRVLQETSDSK